MNIPAQPAKINRGQTRIPAFAMIADCQITHPFIATINRNWDLSVSGRDEGIVIVSGPGSGFAVGGAQ